MSAETRPGQQSDLTPDGFEEMEESRRERQRTRALERGADYYRGRGIRGGATAGSDLSVDESKCQNCGAALPHADFGRELGDNNNIAWGCPECYTWTALKRGAASAEDRHGTIEEEVVVNNELGTYSQTRWEAGERV